MYWRARPAGTCSGAGAAAARSFYFLQKLVETNFAGANYGEILN
jgi:hypothetical protein